MTQLVILHAFFTLIMAACESLYRLVDSDKQLLPDESESKRLFHASEMMVENLSVCKETGRFETICGACSRQLLADTLETSVTAHVLVTQQQLVDSTEVSIHCQLRLNRKPI
jgi:hypothetical protein